MGYFHKTLTKNRWYAFSKTEQLANIGSEYNRFINWEKRGDKENATSAFDRLIELIDLSLGDKKWRTSLPELLRLKEVICDKFIGQNMYHIPSQMLEDYFLYFALNTKK